MADNDVIGNRYQLVQPIGAGGMGTVYRAVDTQTEETVAIKLLKPEVVASDPGMVERFAREAEALRRLNHPNIVKVLATLQENDRHYLVMEYVSGGSLQDILDKEHKLSIDHALTISLELADALSRAHHLKIVHRDIKPGNVLIAEDGTPRLTDFGVAFIGSKERVTQTGAALGTLDYLAPEALEGKGVSPTTDIWAFGVMLYEMLGGRRPFVGDNFSHLITNILTQPFPRLEILRPDCPPALADLVHHMLEKDPQQRISSARQLGAELEAIQRGDDTPSRSRFNTPAPPSSTLEGATTIVNTDELRPLTSRRRTLAYGAIAVLASIGALIAGLTANNKANDRPTATEPVAAVEPGNYTVLIADIENVGGTQREVTRFVADDLHQKFETEWNFGTVRFQRYAGVIGDDAQAQQVAAANNATIIVWGNYNDSRVQLEIQVGSLAAFPYMPFDHDSIAHTANIRVQLTDEQAQSAAPYVAGVLGIIQAADGNQIEVYRAIALIDAIEQTPAELVGQTTANRVHTALAIFVSDTPTSIERFGEAIEMDNGNPLLYFFRATTIYRRVVTGATLAESRDLYNTAASDVNSTRTLGPSAWLGPDWVSLFNPNIAVDEVITTLDTIIAQRPDQWFAYYFRGSFILGAGDIVAAEMFLRQGLNLDPDSSFIYAQWIPLLLGEGRLDEAAQAIDTMIERFPDLTFDHRIVVAVQGELSPETALISVLAKMAIGQYESAGQEFLDFISGPRGRGSDYSMSMLYLLDGIIQCNLGDYENAISSYRTALNSRIEVANLLLAEARIHQGLDATVNLNTIERSDQADLLAPYVAAVQAGTLGCRNIFDVDALQAAQAAYVPPAEETATAEATP